MKLYITRFNKIGLSKLGTAGCALYVNNWNDTPTSYNSEIAIGMGDVPSIYYRGISGGSYIDWMPVLLGSYHDPIKSTATSTTLNSNGSSRFFYFVKASTTKASIDNGY